MDHYQAADEITANLKAGAVGEYLDGDSALEILCDLFQLHCAGALPGESLQDQLKRIDTAVGAEIDKAIDKIISDNVAFVMEAAAADKRDAHSDYRELTTDRHAA